MAWARTDRQRVRLAINSIIYQFIAYLASYSASHGRVITARARSETR